MKTVRIAFALIVFMGLSIYLLNYARKNRHFLTDYDKVLGIIIKLLGIIYTLIDIYNQIFDYE